MEAATAQVQDQVDGAASPDTLGPVHELGAGNREGAVIGVPFVRVAGVGQSAAKPENRRQRNRPQAIHLLLATPGAHGSCFGGHGVAQTAAFLHLEDVAVLGQPIDQGGGQVIVFEEGAPLAKAQVGSDQCGFLLVALLHQGEEQSDLRWLGLGVADLIHLC